MADTPPADPGPDRPDHAAAFFFLGALEPAEQANFNLQNVRLGDGAILEVFGHGVGVWWGSRTRRDLPDVRDATRDWLETIAACHHLSSGIALGVRPSHWVETLVPVGEAVLGFMDSRFRRIAVPPEDALDNKPLRRAVESAKALRGLKHAQPAAKEAWRSALDPSDEAFLSAFRALECIRRLYGEDDEKRKAAWQAMRDDLDVDHERCEVLTEAAISVRHGDRPTSRTQDHAINTARRRRSELLGFATDLVRTKVQRLGVDV